MSDTFYQPISFSRPQSSTNPQHSDPVPTSNYNLMADDAIYVNSDYEIVGGGPKNSIITNQQKSIELRNIDAKLARGHYIYFAAILLLLTAVIVSFAISLDTAFPLQLELCRIVLLVFLAYILVLAITALRNKNYSTQLLVVYFLKWYIVLFVAYCIIKLAFFLKKATLMVVVDVVEFVVILLLTWATIRVRNELKKREDLMAEATMINEYIQ